MAEENNFLDGWILSFLKSSKVLTQSQKEQLVLEMNEYLKRMEETNKKVSG